MLNVNRKRVIKGGIKKNKIKKNNNAKNSRNSTNKQPNTNTHTHLSRAGTCAANLRVHMGKKTATKQTERNKCKSNKQISSSSAS